MKVNSPAKLYLFTYKLEATLFPCHLHFSESDYSPYLGLNNIKSHKATWSPRFHGAHARWHEGLHAGASARPLPLSVKRLDSGSGLVLRAGRRHVQTLLLCWFTQTSEALLGTAYAAVRPLPLAASTRGGLRTRSPIRRNATSTFSPSSGSQVSDIST